MITTKNIIRKLGLSSAQIGKLNDLTATETGYLDVSAGAPGTVGTAASGTIALTTERFGSLYVSTFTLTAARMTVTDGAGSGSYGSLKLLDFPEGYIHIIAGAGKYTAFAEGTALTGEAGDAAFVLGVGTTAISAAADGTLGATEKDIIAQTSTITLSGGTGTGKHSLAANKMHDGTATALDLNLNFSGSAATIDATSTLDITGVVKIAWINLLDA